MEYEVVVGQDILSDGSVCCAAVCPAVNYAHGQGNTEVEALAGHIPRRYLIRTRPGTASLLTDGI